MKNWNLYFNASNSEKITPKISIFNDLWTLYPMSQFKKTMVMDFFSFIRIGECAPNFERFYFEGL
jgi:hypothetical protein